MKKFFKFLLYLLIWVVIGALITGAAILLGHPPATGFKLTGWLFGIWLLYIIIKKIIIRYRAKKRVQNLITEEAPQDPLDAGAKPRFLGLSLFGKASTPDSLKQRFNDFLILLRKSELRKQGNPVYVLPWYFLIGPEQSGKTSILEAAGLPSPVLDQEVHSGEGINWTLYNQAIVFDVPGSYITAKDRLRRGEWGQLLELLAKHRHKEPLNGIVVAIDADRLKNGDKSELTELGRTYQARITEAMKRLKVRIPIYLFVTKGDMIEGMAEWLNGLSEDARQQAMGQAQIEDPFRISEFIPKAIDALAERIKELTLVTAAAPHFSYKSLKVPEGIAGLEERLHCFASAVFQKNPYQEPLQLRGLYLGGINPGEDSSVQAGSGFFLRQFLTEIIPADRKMVSTMTSADRIEQVSRRFVRGGWGLAMTVVLFLLASTFFSNIGYLKDITNRHAGSFVTPARFSEQVDNIDSFRETIISVDKDVSGWWAPWFVHSWSDVFGGRTPAFIDKMKDLYVDRFETELLDPVNALTSRKVQSVSAGAKPKVVIAPTPRSAPNVQGGYLIRVASLTSKAQVRRLIERLENYDFKAFMSGPDKNSWYRVNVGPFPDWESALSQQQPVEALDFVNETILIKMEPSAVANEIAQTVPARPVIEEKSHHTFADQVGALVTRINVLDAFLSNKTSQEIASLPSPFTTSDLTDIGELAGDTVDTYNQLYIQRLFWHKDKERIVLEMKKFRAQLSTLLQSASKDLRWLIPLANERVASTPETELATYWVGTGVLEGDNVRMPGAYTVAGKTFLDSYLTQLLATDPESIELQDMKKSFDAVYKRDYIAAWQKFAMDFNQGMKSLRDRQEWVTMIDVIGSKRNPYFLFLSVMNQQLKPFADGQDLPEWVQLVQYFDKMLAFGPDKIDTGKRDKVLTKLGLKFISKLGPIGKAISGTGKSGMKTQKKVGAATPTADDRDLILEEAGKILGEYIQALEDISFNSESKSVSYKAMEAMFANPEMVGAGDGPLSVAQKSVKRLQMLLGKENQFNKPFWQMYAGSLNVIIEYMYQESMCVIQEKWREEFLVEIENVPEYKLGGLIFGEGGKLWLFMDKMKPFIARRYGKGYAPVVVQERSMRFSSEFLDYVSRGSDNLQLRRDSYPVAMNALPTSTNRGGVLPSVTVLELECSDKPQVFTNYNFAASTVFNWSPKCQDVTLSIEISDKVLEKTYKGPKAFPNFLKDFHDGRYRFTSDSFPDNQKWLSDMGIRHIDVQYEFTGHQDVINTLNMKPMSTPKSIIPCWGQ